MPQLRSEGGEPSAPATPGLLLPSYTTPWDAALYGSRALGRHRPASDIDLALIGPALDATALARIDADRDDLLLPWMIDLSALSAIHHPALLEHIQHAGVDLYRRTDTPG